MFIETESTPNPATLKFLPGRTVTPDGRTVDFAHAGQAAGSPLALRLFGLDHVARVFLGADFVTVTKTEGEDWTGLKPQVLSSLVDHFMSGELAVVDTGAPVANEATIKPEDQEIVAQIKELLDERVRPAVAMDGGDIVFHGYSDGTVFLHMQGSCSGCPSSRATLKHGIENMLRHYVPEVTAVEQVEL